LQSSSSTISGEMTFIIGGFGKEKGA